MRKLLVSVSLFLLGSASAKAQYYTTAAGIRIFDGLGLTMQQHVFDKYTVEGILYNSLKTKNTSVTLLLEKHNNLLTRRLNFYVGGGINYVFLANKAASLSNPYGVAGIAGIELTTGNINLSWDFKPTININGGTSFFDAATGISIRYIFIEKQNLENWKFWKKR